MITTLVFDLGGVLVDWDPRYVYRDLFEGDDDAMERFLADICNGPWNLEQDRGRSLAAGTALLCTEFPGQAALIGAYYGRWPEMLRDEIPGMVELLTELHEAGRVRLLALTNWSAETFPVARERFAWLGLFEGIVVSGEEKLVKPDPAIFELLAKRFGLDPAQTLFVDDAQKNVDGARAAGLKALRFIDALELRRELRRAAVL